MKLKRLRLAFLILTGKVISYADEGIVKNGKAIRIENGRYSLVFFLGKSTEGKLWN